MKRKNVDQLDLFAPGPLSPAGERVGVRADEVAPLTPLEERIRELKEAEGIFEEPARLPSPQPSPPRGEGESGEIELPGGLRLERNLAILAGAGAGKTYSLVTMCLHLLGGARRDFPPLACSELGLLTFTEKAADEMRGRLRERLDALAEGRGDEPALRESFAVAGQQFPPPRRWRALRDDLGAATIGTFHSLCTQLLRRAPPNSGVFPHFELLDDRDARALLRDLVERTLLARVEDGSILRTLVAEIGFGRLVEGLVPIAIRIREEGVSPNYVPVADGPTLRAQFAGELEAFQAQLRNVPVTRPQQLQRHPQAVRAAAQVTWENVEAQLPVVQEALKGVNGWGELRQAAGNLLQIYGACLVAPFEAEVREVLVDIAAAHEEALASRGVLDFTGLLVQARNLLRDFPEARQDAQRRFKALLVDEFQDTNRLQLELVLLLAEQRAGAPRPVSTAFEAQHQEIIGLPQERGFVAIVGDRKQSIYEFRGADVSVFEVMARAIEANGGGRAYLRHSRRSTAPLLEVLNAGFTQALGPSAASSPPQDFEVIYTPEHDDLTAVRRGVPAGVPLLQLDDSRLGPDKRAADDQRAADAEAVSRAVSDGLAGAWTVMEGKAGEVERPARGGDVALLFQRFTQLEVYRQALVRHGVRHRVVRGRGFYGAQEIVDLASFLAVLADPDDALSLSAVLRSPLVGLTDAEWVGLARPREGERWHLDARWVLTGRAEIGSPPFVPSGVEGLLVPAPQRAPSEPSVRSALVQLPLDSARGERALGTGAGSASEVPARIITLRERYAALREERDRLGLRALLRVVLEVFEYRVAVAAGPFGEQALANLDKLLVLASAREARGAGVSAFARELLELADDAPKEAQGEVVDELDLEAVTLCTVHQAKGLEWPIVVLPDLPTQPRTENAAVRFDRSLGLSLVRPKGTTDLRSLSATQISNQLTRRARAENLRLLYVAMTRARDRLVLGLRPQSSPHNTWANDLNAFFSLKVSGDQPERLDVSKLGLRKPEPVVPVPGFRAEVERIIAHVRAPRESTTTSMVLPVTQLQDLVSCPRRFHFAHQVGLSERPVSFEWRDEESGDDDVRARGTAAHKLLELTPLAAVGTTGLGAILRELRRTSGLERVAGDDVMGWVERFWATDFGRSLTGAAVHRELPFALRLPGADQSPLGRRRGGGDGPTLVLRGQIDLLVVREGEVLVIDYKTSTMPSAGLEPYRFQLGCYALAAQRFVGASLPMRAGIVFLRDESPEPQFLPHFDFTQFAAPLVRESAGLAEAQRTGVWPGRPRERCDALGCGYVYRCHP